MAAAGGGISGTRTTSPQTLETILLLLLSTAAVLVGAALAGVHASVLVTEGHAARAPWGELLRGLGRLPSSPGDPAGAFPPGTGVPGPLAFWALFVATVAAIGGSLVTVIAWALRAMRRSRLSLPGRQDLAPLGGKALARRGSQLRPTTGADGASAVGVRLGRATSARADVWCSAEDTLVVYGPPRSGKTMHVVIPAVLDWPGPTVVTGTRPDVLVHTLAARAARGPCAVFDPLGAWQAGVDGPWGLRWSPVSGCEQAEVAWRRARVLVRASGGAKGVENATYWDNAATAVLRALLHAAAVTGRPASLVRLWAADPDDDEPIRVLDDQGPAGWAGELHAATHADPRTVANVYAGVRQAVDVLGLPQVAERCDVAPRDSWRPDDLLDRDGALYLLGTPAEQEIVAPLVAALVDAVVHAAERRAAAATGGRLDPPLLLALDEVANVAPLPSLPQLLSTGGGSGLVTMAVLQSPSQARARWGRDGAATMRDSSRIRMVLGGLAAGDDLEELSRSWGERDDLVRSTSVDRGGHHSISDSVRRIRVAPVERLRALPPGMAMIAAGAHPPVELQMTPWWQRSDRAQVEAGRAWAEQGGKAPVP